MIGIDKVKQEERLNFPRNFVTDKNLSIVCRKQPSKGILMKSCSENIQQIYRRALIPKCNFIELQSNFTEVALYMGVLL